ncbi:hypothetical protein BJY00DRAFT_295795 [Aspergillus carlsbadensis]|nr:hypothetical protein BJY00DRAFT_295795 [Aspergillus carlsbadensis]
MVTVLSVNPARPTSQPPLPIELIWKIIDLLVPSEGSLVPRDHALTRTLLNLALACRITHYKAHELLLTCCMHLNSQTALRRFNIATEGCLLDCGAHHRTHGREMYLAPFTHRNQVTEASAGEIDVTFSMLAGSLRRLVLDFPWRGFYPEGGDGQPTIILGRAFRRLRAIEEFVSVSDDLPLDVPQEEPDYQYVAWSTWPQLRRLSLSSPYIDAKSVEALLRCPHLTHLVIAKPRGWDDPLPDDLAQRVSWDRLGLRRMTVLRNARRPARRFDWRSRNDTPGFGQSFLGRLITTLADRVSERTPQPEIRYVDVPPVPYDPTDRVEVWIREHALDGTIWDSHGRLYEPVA